MNDKKIMVVDDECMVRNIMQNQLEISGYNVITAEDGNEAIRLFKKSSDDIELVLLDLHMPGKDGIDTLKEIQSIQSDIKVILMSGSFVEEDLPHIINSGNLGYLSKPFKLQMLADKVNDALYEKMITKSQNPT